MERQAEGLTVAAYLDRWLAEHVALLRPTSQRTYRRAVERWYRPLLGDVLLSELTASHCQSVVNVMVDEGVAYNSIRSAAGAFSSAITRAHENRLIDRNPARVRLLRLPDPGPPTVTGLSRAEMDRFLHHALTPGGTGGRHWYGPMLAAALMTGMRYSELRGLWWDDIELAERSRGDVDGTLFVQRQLISDSGALVYSSPKSQSGYRSIPISSELGPILRAHRERMSRMPLRKPRWVDNGLVFPNKSGGGASDSSLMETRRRLSKLAKLDVVPTFHAFRHTYASILVEGGVPAGIVAALLGHESVDLTIKVYYDVGEVGRQSAASAVAKAMRQRRRNQRRG